MTADTIPIDFIAGSHGHYLESVCNYGFGFVTAEYNFTKQGTSHVKSAIYQQNKVFNAGHWSELIPESLLPYKKIIAIKFTQDDLLLLASVSLLRAGDLNIDNDQLESNTVEKLNSKEYRDTLELIYQSYPTLNKLDPDIPRTVLREFFKFGFKNPNINGYWQKQNLMKYQNYQNVFEFKFKSFYHIDNFISELQNLAKFLKREFVINDAFYKRHQDFMNFIPFIKHKEQCDRIIDSIVNKQHIDLPKLTLLQESYINGNLENIYQKEMPFHQEKYFNSTEDVLYYLNKLAPNL